MSKTIDNRIVQMEFENESFERKAKQTTKTLNVLDDSLRFKHAKKSFKDVEKAAKRTNFNSFIHAADTVTARLSNMGVVGMTALSNITNKAVDAGTRLVKSLSVDQVIAGWSKMDQITRATGTLIAQGYDISEVEEQISRLNWFTDETSYNLTDMVDNISKFTATGKGLTDSATAMEGIALWAALSGQNATTASRAMFQLSQALGAGYMRLEDYKSIQNASMDTDEFRQKTLDAAVALGTLQKNADDTYTALTGSGTTFTKSQFAQSLTEGMWFTSDVMMEVFKKYSSTVDQVYEYAAEHGITASQAIEELGDSVDEFGLKAFRAGQEARTFGDAIDATKDAVSTGWMSTFKNIFGNYEEQRVLWTNLANGLYDFFVEPINGLNEMLEYAFSSATEEEIKFASDIRDSGIVWAEFKDILAEVAREHGMSIDTMLAGSESLDDALKSGVLQNDFFAEAIDRYSGSITKSVTTVVTAGEQLDDATRVVKEILDGKWGSGHEAITRLTKAGYDAGKMLDYVDEYLEKGYIDAKNFYDLFFDTTDKDLEKADILKKLSAQIRETDRDLSEMMRRTSEYSGRALFITGLENSLNAIVERVTFLNELISGVFTPDDGTRLRQIIRAFAELSETFTMTDDEKNTWRQIIRGILVPLKSGIKFVKEFTKSFEPLVQIPKKIGTDIITALAKAGTYLETVFSNKDFSGQFDWLTNKTQSLTDSVLKFYEYAKDTKRGLLYDMKLLKQRLDRTLIPSFLNFMHAVRTSGNPIGTILSEAKRVFPGVISYVKKTFKEVNILDAILPKFKQAIIDHPILYRKSIVELYNFLSSVNKAGKPITAFFRGLDYYVRRTISKYPILNGILSQFDSWIDSVRPKISRFRSAVSNNFKTVFNSIDALRDRYELLKSYHYKTYDGTPLDMLKQLKKLSFSDKAVLKIFSIFDRIREIPQTLRYFKSLVKLKSMYDILPTSLPTGAKAIVSIVDFIGKLPEKIQSVTAQLKRLKILSVLKDTILLPTSLSDAENAIINIFSFFNRLPKMITHTFGKIPLAFEKIKSEIEHIDFLLWLTRYGKSIGAFEANSTPIERFLVRTINIVKRFNKGISSIIDTTKTHIKSIAVLFNLKKLTGRRGLSNGIDQMIADILDSIYKLPRRLSRAYLDIKKHVNSIVDNTLKHVIDEPRILVDALIRTGKEIKWAAMKLFYAFRLIGFAIRQNDLSLITNQAWAQKIINSPMVDALSNFGNKIRISGMKLMGAFRLIGFAIRQNDLSLITNQAWAQKIINSPITKFIKTLVSELIISAKNVSLTTLAVFRNIGLSIIKGITGVDITEPLNRFFNKIKTVFQTAWGYIFGTSASSQTSATTITASFDQMHKSFSRIDKNRNRIRDMNQILSYTSKTVEELYGHTAAFKHEVNASNGFDFSKLFDVAVIGAVAGSLFVLINAVRKFGNVAESLSGVFKSVQKVIKARKSSNIIRTIETIARSIFLLAAAIGLLSLIPTEKLIPAVIAIDSAIVLLIGVAIACAILSKKLSAVNTDPVSILNFQKILSSIGYAMLKLSVAMTYLAKAGIIDDLDKAMGAVAIMGFMAMELYALTKYTSKIDGSSPKSALSLVIIASSLLIMAVAIGIIGKALTKVGADTSMLIMVGMIVTLLVISNVASKVSVKPFLAIMAIVSSLVIIAGLLGLIGKLHIGAILSKWAEFLAVFNVLLLGIVTVGILSKYFKGVSKDLLYIGVGVFAMIGAMGLIAVLCRFISKNRNASDMQKAAGIMITIGLIIIGMVAVLGLLGKIPDKGTKAVFTKLAFSVLGLVAAVATMVLLLRVMKNMKYSDYSNALTILGDVVGDIAILLLVFGTAAKLSNGKGAAIIISLVVGMIAMVALLSRLQHMIQDGGIRTAMLVLLGVVVMFSAAVIALGFAIKLAGKSVNGTAILIATIVAFVAVAAALAIVGRYDWKSSLAAAGGMAIVLIAMGGLVAILSALKISWTTLGSLIVIAAVAVAFGIVMAKLVGVISLLNSSDWSAIGKLGVIALILAGIVAVMVGLAAVISLVPIIMAGLGVLAVVLILSATSIYIFSAAMDRMQGIDLEKIAKGMKSLAGPMALVGLAGILMIAGSVGMLLGAVGILALSGAAFVAAGGISVLTAAMDGLIFSIARIGWAAAKNGLGGATAAALGDLYDEMVNQGDDIQAAASDIGTNVQTAQADAISASTDAVTDAVKTSSEAVQESIVDAGAEANEVAADQTEQVMATVEATVAKEGSRVNFWDIVKNGFNVGDILGGLFGEIKNWISENGLGGLLDGLDLKEAFGNADLSTFADGFKEKVSSIIDLDGADFSKITESMSSQLTNASENVDTDAAAKAVAEKYTSALSGAMSDDTNTSSIVEAGANLGESADSGFRTVDTSETALYFVQGVAVGIRDHAGEVYAEAAKLGKNGVAALNTAMDIHSPSKKTYRSGKFFVIGLSKAILDYAGIAYNSATDLATGTMYALNSAIEGDISNPRITPVLDMSDVYAQMQGFDIDGTMRPVIRPTVDTRGVNPVLGNMRAIAATKSAREMAEIGQNGSTSQTQTSTTTFNQYNYSPKALSRKEIYRRTNNLVNSATARRLAIK